MKPRDRRQPERPRLPWTAARPATRQCPLGIVQQLTYHAVSFPTAMQNRVTKTISVAHTKTISVAHTKTISVAPPQRRKHLVYSRALWPITVLIIGNFKATPTPTPAAQSAEQSIRDRSLDFNAQSAMTVMSGRKHNRTYTYTETKIHVS